jgi:hypothetical protein
MFSSHGGHSADVRISLMFGGHSIPVAQLGPDFLLLDAPADHPPGPASILLRVDQRHLRSLQAGSNHGLRIADPDGSCQLYRN